MEDSGRIQLTGPWPEWHDSAWSGLWFPPEDAASTPILAILGPPGSAIGLDRARHGATRWLALREPGVLPLRAVLAYEGRIAWVYDHIEALGVVHLIGTTDEERLPYRCAGELVARVAERLDRLGDVGLVHPGPEPADLLVDADGQPWLTGFSGPYPPPPILRDPTGTLGEDALVWRVGVLFARVLTGSPPAVADGPAAHEVALRRVLVRALGRRGASFPERYRDWVLGMLAWSPTARPPLSTIPERLAETAAEVAGPSLDEWCARKLPALREIVRSRTRPDLEEFDDQPTADVQRPPLPPPAIRTPPPPLAPNPRLRPDDLPPDEPTMESDQTTSNGRRRAVELGAIPVFVGPPPGALTRIPRLPADILTPGPIPRRPERPSRAPTVALAAITTALVLAALALAVYLF